MLVVIAMWYGRERRDAERHFGRDLKDQIAATTDADTLDTIDITKGWPT